MARMFHPTNGRQLFTLKSTDDLVRHFVGLHAKPTNNRVLPCVTVMPMCWYVNE
jgi:hypothetical protein